MGIQNPEYGPYYSFERTDDEEGKHYKNGGAWHGKLKLRERYEHLKQDNSPMEVNQIEVTQNAADEESTLTCVPDCPQEE